MALYRTKVWAGSGRGDKGTYGGGGRWLEDRGGDDSGELAIEGLGAGSDVDLTTFRETGTVAVQEDVELIGAEGRKEIDTVVGLCIACVEWKVGNMVSITTFFFF